MNLQECIFIERNSTGVLLSLDLSVNCQKCEVSNSDSCHKTQTPTQCNAVKKYHSASVGYKHTEESLQ